MSIVPTTDLPLSQFRCVRVTSLDGRSNTDHMVHESQVAVFVEAQKALHYEPGVNPHNGNATLRIGSIRVLSYEAHAPRWWSTPDLMRNGDPAGAIIFDLNLDADDEWVHPQVLREEDEQFRREVEAEARS